MARRVKNLPARPAGRQASPPDDVRVCVAPQLRL